MYKLKRLIKHALAYSLYYSGILFWMKRAKLKNRTLVLMLHRVLPESLSATSFSHDAIIISDDKFDDLLDFLKGHFSVLDIEEFSAHIINNKPLPDQSCLLTFDDGWVDNYQFAFPILKRHNTPAVVFLPVDYIDENELFWQEALGHILSQCVASKSPSATAFLERLKLDYLIGQTEDAQRVNINQYVRSLKAMKYDELDQLINDAKNALGSVDYGNVDRYLGAEQIALMQEAGISFGSHARSHRILTRMPKTQLDDELNYSRERIQALTHKPVQTIAYPNGDHNEQVCQATADAGYDIGFTTNFGYTRHDDDPYRIKRININNAICTNRPILLATLLGVFS